MSRLLRRVGMKVVTDSGSGVIVYVNSQRRTVKVQLEGQKSRVVSWDDLAAEENS